MKKRRCRKMARLEGKTRGEREIASIGGQFQDWERLALADIWLSRAIILGSAKKTGQEIGPRL